LRKLGVTYVHFTIFSIAIPMLLLLHVLLLEEEKAIIAAAAAAFYSLCD